jgi:hypothetical protein
MPLPAPRLAPVTIATFGLYSDIDALLQDEVAVKDLALRPG